MRKILLDCRQANDPPDGMVSGAETQIVLLKLRKLRKTKDGCAWSPVPTCCMIRVYQRRYLFDHVWPSNLYCVQRRVLQLVAQKLTLGRIWSTKMKSKYRPVGTVGAVGHGATQGISHALHALQLSYLFRAPFSQWCSTSKGTSGVNQMTQVSTWTWGLRCRCRGPGPKRPSLIDWPMAEELLGEFREMLLRTCPGPLQFSFKNGQFVGCQCWINSRAVRFIHWDVSSPDSPVPDPFIPKISKAPRFYFGRRCTVLQPLAFQCLRWWDKPPAICKTSWSGSEVAWIWWRFSTPSLIVFWSIGLLRVYSTPFEKGLWIYLLVHGHSNVLPPSHCCPSCTSPWGFRRAAHDLRSGGWYFQLLHGEVQAPWPRDNWLPRVLLESK